MESNSTFDSLVAQYGLYTDVDGTEYCLEQNPYLDNIRPGVAGYVAEGYDRVGNHLRLIWEITNNETEDESEACDWDDFEAYDRGGDTAPWYVAE